MQVADERGFAPPPGFRQVFQPDCNSPNPRQTRVEDAEEAAQQSCAEEYFHNSVKVRVQSRQQHNPEDNPGQSSGKEQETDKSEPHRSDSVKNPQHRVGMTEGQDRRRKKTHGQGAQDDLQQWGRRKIVPRCRKRPRLEKKNMNQKQNGLKDGQKADEARWYSHVYLDSRSTQKVICEFTGHRDGPLRVIDLNL
jgi:hypothetical protein